MEIIEVHSIDKGMALQVDMPGVDSIAVGALSTDLLLGRNTPVQPLDLN